jgi:hypothetical protein
MQIKQTAMRRIEAGRLTGELQTQIAARLAARSVQPCTDYDPV